MESSLFNRAQLTLLALATLGLCILAVLNLRQESQFQQPDDGVWWREASGGLEAVKVLPNSPGQRAGIQAHDLLTGAEVLPDSPAQQTGMQAQDLLGGVKPEQEKPSPRDGIQAKGLLPIVNYIAIAQVADLERILNRTGSYGKANYAITRQGEALDTPVVVIPEPLDRSLFQFQRVIGLIYLAIGIYVLFRRWTAPRATHFYLFCLVSFALYALKYTGMLVDPGWQGRLDWSVFWVNVLAESLQPALFLHFALSFPEERVKNVRRRRWLLPLVYAPGAGLLGLWLWAIETRQATGLLKHSLDRTGTAYEALFYVLAALLFLRSYSQANTPLQRQQLKWLTRGTLLAVGPFTLYAIFFLFDQPIPSLFANLAGLSMVFLPLTFSWAIIRYRLMDTDLIFKRGVAYTLATALLLGAYFGIIALIALMVHTRLPDTVREWGMVLSILVTAALFEPLKRRIQGWVDRAFDRQRYDYRKALIDFGRGLSSETDLQALLESIVERLPSAMLVARVAVFMAKDRDGSGGLHLAAAHGLPPEVAAAQDSLALGFLDFDQ